MAATLVPHPTPCGLQRGEFSQLHAQHYGQPIWGTYFFTNVPGTKKHRPRTDLDDHVVRCLECGCTIGEHNMVDARVSLADGVVESGCVLKATLSSWRNVYGARKMVVNEARKREARGCVAVDGMDIIVDLWFPVQAGGQFVATLEKVCENPMSHLRCPQLNLEVGMRGDRQLVMPYGQLHDIPNMASTSLSTTATRDLRGTLHRYQSIDKEDIRYGEIIHIVPSACLRNGKKVGAWDLLFGSSKMNKMSDGDVPVVDITFLDVHETEERDGRVFAVLQVDFTRAGSVHIVFPDDCVQVSSWVYLAKVGVESCHLERFRLALKWRGKAVEDAIRRQKAGESLHNKNRPAGSAWWVYPLGAGLTEFTKRARSPEALCAEGGDSEQE